MHTIGAGLASCLRESGKLASGSFVARVGGQRVFSIACGYQTRTTPPPAGDPIYKLLLDRDPGRGRDLLRNDLVAFREQVGIKDCMLGHFWPTA